MIRPIYFRACPKCSGDLRPVTDLFGSYLACVQCGNSVYPDSHGRFGNGRLLGAASAPKTTQGKR